MASMLFDQLYQQTLERDHVKLNVTRNLWHSLESVSIPACGHLADGLMRLGDDFEAELNDVVVRNRMRVRHVPQICPDCKSAVCPGAVPISSLPEEAMSSVKGLLGHLLKGGTPPEDL